MNQVRLAGRFVPSSVAALTIGEGGELVVEVAPFAVVVEVNQTLLHLFWQRGKGMIVLGHLAARSRRPL